MYWHKETNEYRDGQDAHVFSITGWSDEEKPIKDRQGRLLGNESTFFELDTFDLWVLRDRQWQLGGEIPPAPAYDTLDPVGDHLYKSDYSTIDYDYAYDYFDNHTINLGFSCSAIVKGSELGKNNDWFYDNNAELIIKTPHTSELNATLGVASAIDGLTDDVCKYKFRSEAFKIAPFMLVDGINEHGLAISVNIVPKEKGQNNIIGTGTTQVHSRMLLRYLLDHCSSVDDAIETCQNDLTVLQSENRDKDAHFLLTDGAKSVCLEFINDEFVVTDCEFITNFHIGDVTFNDDGTVYTPETRDDEQSATTTNNITEHGSGLERYNIIATAESDALLSDILESLLYTHTYSENESHLWYTEFVNNTLTVDSFPEDFASALQSARQAFEERSRDTGLTWHTTHSAIYNTNDKTLSIKSQEGDEIHTFELGE